MIRWEENPIPHYTSETRRIETRRGQVTMSVIMHGSPSSFGSVTAMGGGAGGGGACSVVRHGPPEHGTFKDGDVYRDEAGDYWTYVKGGLARPAGWVCRPGGPAPWGKVIAAAYGDLCCPASSLEVCSNRYCLEYRRAVNAPPELQVYPPGPLCAPRPARQLRPRRERRVPCSRQWMAWMVVVYAALIWLAPTAGFWFGLVMAGAAIRDWMSHPGSVETPADDMEGTL